MGVFLRALVGLLATGCSFEFSVGGGSAVDSAEVAAQAAGALEEAGRTLGDLTCSEDLPTEVDASICCELTGYGLTYGVTITTTSVEGTDVDFTVVVDEEPLN